MKQLTLDCAYTQGDWLECDVVSDKVYVGSNVKGAIGPADIALTPTQARELATWLEQAAFEAEQADES